MKSKNNILREQDASVADKAAKKPVTPAVKKYNVLFIGDADTDTPGNYAQDILNSGLVTGKIVTTQGDITKLFSLVQSNMNDDYDIVSLMFSNAIPDLKTDAIDLLNVMFETISNTGAKLISISPPTKDFAPYGHVKYANTAKIAEWVNTQNVSSYNINAYELTRNKIFFQKNKILLNREGHSIIAKQWLRYLAQIQPDNVDAIDKKAAAIDKNVKLAKNTKILFKVGDKSPKIMVLQRRLLKLDYAIDANEAKVGEFGKSTYNAVKMFQLINEIPVTGMINDVTARGLLNSSAKSFSKWHTLFANAPDFIKDLGLNPKDKKTINTIVQSAPVAAAVGSSISDTKPSTTSNTKNTGKNGKLSGADLKSIGNGQKLSPKAADAYLEMEKAAKEDGVTFDVTDSYRTFEIQDANFDWDRYNQTGERKKRGTDIAMALPGTSNHGWGKAIDVFPKKAQDWIKQNGEKYGWSWAEGRSVGENWHFTYVG
jgi:peptidoglycan hydrolase-like protein with peptidoglycan-binding domain